MARAAGGQAGPAGDNASLRQRPRLESVDLLRGVVMALMALDHTRAFFSEAWAIDPTDLAQTNVALFLTRWVTHFCAPVFVFLAGTAAYLGRGARTTAQLAARLLARGLWLVALEIVLTGHLVYGSFSVHEYPAGPIWAIGWSMVILAGLVFLPTPLVVGVGVAMVAGHNLFDRLSPPQLGFANGLWIVLHVPGDVQMATGLKLAVHYPLVPWIGVMALGYGFGWLVGCERPVRRRWSLCLGLGAVAAFVIIRSVDIYGDPRPWAPQPTLAFTLLSWLNCTKYPPSLLYVLMTLGPAVALLPLWEKGLGRLSPYLVTFGRVPLFYFVAHIMLLYVLFVLLGWPSYGARILASCVGPNPPGYGYSLPPVYAIWLGVLFVMYPACRWYAKVKRDPRRAWLSYL